jgi:outer membrane protein OmpA-like peptidoglycan-associated protein
MDVLQGRLTQEIGKDARIERRGDSIVLSLPMGFDIDSPQLNESGRQTLRPLAAILLEYRLTLVAVQIRGVDSDAHGANSRLASDRAGALSRYLTDSGVAGKRIASASEGSGVPEAAPQGDTPERTGIELRVSPIVGTGAGQL